MDKDGQNGQRWIKMDKDGLRWTERLQIITIIYVM